MVIREGNMDEVVRLSALLPEFDDPYGEEELRKRLGNVKHLILVAEVNGEAAAFKVGYEREKDGSFYSWLGGVLPAYRRKGLALQLALAQEAWALDQGYTQIKFKTRNRHKAMLHFALGRGFYITGLELCPDPMEHRIWLMLDLGPASPPQSGR